LKTETPETLRLKYGKELEEWWYQRFGFGFDYYSGHRRM
jgi:hypothetical protein